MPDRARLLQEVILEDGSLKSFVVEQEDHRIRHLPAGVSSESDADGERVPIRDAAGVVKGYVGYSAGANGLLVWLGDLAGAEAYSVPLFALFPDGSVYLQAADGKSLGVDATGKAIIDATHLAVLSASNGAGIDGQTVIANATDAASVIARLNELLAVCRNLGIIHA